MRGRRLEEGREELMEGSGVEREITISKLSEGKKQKRREANKRREN